MKKCIWPGRGEKRVKGGRRRRGETGVRGEPFWTTLTWRNVLFSSAKERSNFQTFLAYFKWKNPRPEVHVTCLTFTDVNFLLNWFVTCGQFIGRPQTFLELQLRFKLHFPSVKMQFETLLELHKRLWTTNELTVANLHFYLFLHILVLKIWERDSVPNLSYLQYAYFGCPSRSQDRAQDQYRLENRKWKMEIFHRLFERCVIVFPRHPWIRIWNIHRGS